MKLVIGIDRDGVINQDLGSYCYQKEKFIPIEGSLESIAKLKSLGYFVTVITNQGGIEKGIYTKHDVDSVHKYMLSLLLNTGCRSIDGIYYSSSSSIENLHAKPNVGMFIEFEKDHPEVKFQHGYFVGDKITDLLAAEKIKATPVLVKTGYGTVTEKLLEDTKYKTLKLKTLIFENLKHFVDVITDENFS
jgi:histidinol-phosphate phosphatase family protein